VSIDDSQLGEFDLIRRYFSRIGAGRADVVLGVGDDAALLRVPSDAELAAAVDTIVAGRHFPFGTDARSIGHRALAVNLSDLAAMGATPAWATLALTLPSADPEWLERFSGGFSELANAHGVALVGGDTTAGPLTVSVQIMGHVQSGTALRRSGAQAGDLLAVTGTLGDAGAGLALATASLATDDAAAARELQQRFDYPTPRVEFGMVARGIATAAMDLSDGLAGDLPKLASASGLAAHVDIERLPLSPALQSVASPQQARSWALGAGDDYELLVALPPRHYGALTSRAAQLNLRLTVIGELRRGNHVSWALHGEEFAPPVHGYDHFRRASTQITV
jgi:thiamine-monophosphate kinase